MNNEPNKLSMKKTKTRETGKEKREKRNGKKTTQKLRTRTFGTF